jgi:isopentenyldiphosphate isomerase
MFAARRRLGEELGVTGELSFGFFARYQAELGNGMHENELVYVYFGRLQAEPKPDPAEVADVAHWSFDDISRRIAREPDSFTFWFKHYFRNHGREIARLAKRPPVARRRDPRGTGIGPACAPRLIPGPHPP